MSLEVLRIGGNGAAIGIGGVGGLVERFLAEAEIVEEMSVRGIFGSQVRQQLERGSVITPVESLVSLGVQRVFLRLRSGGIRGSGGELGTGGDHSQEAEEKHCDEGAAFCGEAYSKG
jgi:hypothetical protein